MSPKPRSSRSPKSLTHRRLTTERTFTASLNPNRTVFSDLLSDGFHFRPSDTNTTPLPSPASAFPGGDGCVRRDVREAPDAPETEEEDAAYDGGEGSWLPRRHQPSPPTPPPRPVQRPLYPQDMPRRMQLPPQQQPRAPQWQQPRAPQQQQPRGPHQQQQREQQRLQRPQLHQPSPVTPPRRGEQLPLFPQLRTPQQQQQQQQQQQEQQDTTATELGLRGGYGPPQRLPRNTPQQQQQQQQAPQPQPSRAEAWEQWAEQVRHWDDERPPPPRRRWWMWWQPQDDRPILPPPPPMPQQPVQVPRPPPPSQRPQPQAPPRPQQQTTPSSAPSSGAGSETDDELQELAQRVGELLAPPQQPLPQQTRQPEQTQQLAQETPPLQETPPSPAVPLPWESLTPEQQENLRQFFTVSRLGEAIQRMPQYRLLPCSEGGTRIPTVEDWPELQRLFPDSQRQEEAPAAPTDLILSREDRENLEQLNASLHLDEALQPLLSPVPSSGAQSETEEELQELAQRLGDLLAPEQQGGGNELRRTGARHGQLPPLDLPPSLLPLPQPQRGDDLQPGEMVHHKPYWDEVEQEWGWTTFTAVEAMDLSGLTAGVVRERRGSEDGLEPAAGHEVGEKRKLEVSGGESEGSASTDGEVEVGTATVARARSGRVGRTGTKARRVVKE